MTVRRQRIDNEADSREMDDLDYKSHYKGAGELKKHRQTVPIAGHATSDSGIVPLIPPKNRPNRPFIS
jgi:hypothetical protein